MTMWSSVGCGARNAEQYGDDEPARVFPRHQELRNDADDRSEEHPAQQSKHSGHLWTASAAKNGPSARNDVEVFERAAGIEQHDGLVLLDLAAGHELADSAQRRATLGSRRDAFQAAHGDHVRDHLLI